MRNFSSLPRLVVAILFCLVCLPAIIFAQKPTLVPDEQRSVLFVPNRGQIVDSRGQKRPDVLYRAELGGVELYLSRDRVSYVFTRYDGDLHRFLDEVETMGVDKATPVIAHHYRMDAELVGASTELQVIPEDQGLEYTNYYLANCPEGIERVPTFRRVLYRDVYPKIDMVIVGTEHGTTCDFIVHPGGKVSDIGLRYIGADRVDVSDSGTLVASTPLGFVGEDAPYTFQPIGEEALRQGDVVASSYRLDGDVVRFSVGRYDSTRTLIIDPNRQWSTYYGGRGTEELNGGDPSEVDRSGNVLITGYTTSNAFPTTAGTAQTTYGGGASFGDAFVVKFDGRGNRLWATYYGGSTDEISHGIATDFDRNVFIAGHTGGSFPVYPTSGAYQTSFGGGGRDAFVVKLDSSGRRLWATYYGGNQFDDGYGFAVDSSGNVAVLVTTASSGLGTSGTFQPNKANGTGNNDALLAKFTAAGSLLWATYYGGSSDDYGYAAASDTNDNIFITGWTNSSNFPVSSGAVQGTIGGGYDAFVVKFNNNGTRQWATYFGGSGRENQDPSGVGYCGIATDGPGNVCIGGTTTGSFPTTTGAAQTTYGGGARDGFIAKFTAGGSLLWSTYCGGNGDDAATGVASNTVGGVLVTGFTFSTNFPVTATANQWTYGGGGDAFIEKLSATGALQWSTYYGGTGADQGEGISFDAFGSIMVAGFTNSTNFPVTTGAYQTGNAGGYDAFMVLFCDMERPTIDSSGPKTICEGDSVILSVPVGYADYHWYINNAASASDTLNQIVVKRSGTYAVKVWNAGGCSDFSDTVRVTVNPKPIVQITGPRSLCTGDTALLDAGPGFASYHWSTGEVTQSIRAWLPGTYGIRITNSSGCTDSTSFALPLNPRPTVDISPKMVSTLCEGDSVQFTATGSPDVTQFVWSDGQTGPKVWAKTNGYYSVRALNQYGCMAKSDSVKITVNPKPLLKLVPSGHVLVCRGDSLALVATPGLGRYKWSTGDSVSRIMIRTSGFYAIRVTDANGCSADASVQVDYIDRPKPILQQIGSTNLCDGDSLVLDAGAGYSSYVWSNQQVGQQLVVRTSGTYFVTVAAAAGCNGQSDTVHVTVGQRPVVKLTGPVSVCANYNGLYTASFAPNARYTWSVTGKGASVTAGGDGTDSLRVQWGPTGAGHIMLMVQDTLTSCSTQLDLPVDVGSALVPTITANRPLKLCAGDTVVLDAGAGYSNYSWSTGESSRAITVRNSGVYLVTVTDNSGCQGQSIPFEIRENDPPTPRIAAGSTSICPGDSVVLDAGAFASYAWSSGDTTRSIVVKKAGTFTVSVTDTNGCSGNAASIAIVVRDAPLPVIDGPTSVCINTTENYAAVAPNAKNSYVWNVSSGGKILSGQGTPAISVQWGGAGNETIDVREQSGSTLCVTDAATLHVSVGTGLLPTITPSGKAQICAGDSLTIFAPSGYDSYLWSTGDTTKSIRVGASGKYAVHVADRTGCSGSSDSIAVQVVPRPTPAVTPASAAICAGSSVVLGTDGAFSSYRWSTGDTTPTITVSQAGKYAVTVVDALGCDGRSQSATVTLLALPPVPTIVERGDTLISTQALTYQWNDSGVPIPGATADRLYALDSGLYTVTVTNAAGCSSTSLPFDAFGVANASISLPVIEAAPGEHVIIPLLLDASRNLRRENADSFRIRFSYNRTLLHPVTPMAASADVGTDRQLIFKGARPEDLNDGTLAEFEFVAELGDALSTPLTIESFQWRDSTIAITTFNGLFRLRGLCLDGGTRLIKITGATDLKPSRPNPASGMTQIEYETVETGATQLYLTDMLGRRVLTVVNGMVQAGRYVATFDASTLASGLYFCVLQTPTEHLNRPLQVAR